MCGVCSVWCVYSVCVVCGVCNTYQISSQQVILLGCPQSREEVLPALALVKV